MTDLLGGVGVDLCLRLLGPLCSGAFTASVGTEGAGPLIGAAVFFGGALLGFVFVFGIGLRARRRGRR